MHGHRTIHMTMLILTTLLALFANSQNGLASDDTTNSREAKEVTAPSPPSAGEASESPSLAIQSGSLALQTTTDEPFESSAFPVIGGPLAHVWQVVRNSVLADMASLARCSSSDGRCSPAAQLLRQIIADGRSHDGLARLGVINRAINLAIKPMNDPYGWRSPLESLSAGQGDCKDYAVIKYLALLQAGFAEKDVKLVIVQDAVIDQTHAIVVVRLNGDWVVLDNRWLALVRDFELRRAIPLYILDENGVRRFDQQEASSDSLGRAGATKK
jgi:predicted transglutaminase-like cysteine proteinase